MNVRERLEAEYCNTFKGYSDDILKQLAIFIESNEFALTTKLGKMFRKVCTTIGHDPRFTGMIEFRSLVRSKDLKVAELIQRIEARLKDGAGEDTKTPIEKFEPLYMRFYWQVDKLTYDIYNEYEREKANDGESVVSQFGKRIRWLLKREESAFTPAQLELIQRFRKLENQWSFEERHEITKPISEKDEIQLFNKYADPLEKELQEFESKGWWNSTKYYAGLWLEYLEKIAQFHEKNPPIVEVVRKRFNKIQEWLKRLEVKYKGRPQVEQESGYGLNDEMRKMILQYKIDRKSFRIQEENKRILRLIEQNHNYFGEQTHNG